MSARSTDHHFAWHFGAALGAATALGAVPVAWAWVGGAHAGLLLLVPAPALVAFLVGFTWKVVRWMQGPVPYHVPLTAGQQRGVGSEPHSLLGSPETALEVAARVAVDALLFRPLLRGTPSALVAGSSLHRFSGRWLWLWALAFHGSLAIIALRHLRLVLSPVPGFVAFLERFDSVTDLAVPALHVTSILFVVALGLLLGRRLVVPRLRYISLAADYFPLLVLILIGSTGLVMRHFTRPDVVDLKALTMGLASFRVEVPAEVDPWLLVHVFLVSTLLAYFPTSKLMHAIGSLMSPTLNLANDSRAVRHVNALNPVVKTLHYDDYEATFRDRMVAAGLPVDTQPPAEHGLGATLEEK